MVWGSLSLSSPRGGGTLGCVVSVTGWGAGCSREPSNAASNQPAKAETVALWPKLKLKGTSSTPRASLTVHLPKGARRWARRGGGADKIRARTSHSYKYLSTKTTNINISRRIAAAIV